MKSPDMAGWIVRNPCVLARPKAPKAYLSESTKSLDNDQVRALVQVVKARDDVILKRDYALRMFYLLTGLRREEVARLKWGDLKINDRIVVTIRIKVGEIVNREIKSPELKTTIMKYLESSGRLENLQADSPLWTRHDRAGKPGGRLSSHSISKSMKKYAKLARIDQFNLHKFRHNHARILGDINGSIRIVQDELGHSSEAVTRIYLQTLGVKRDLYSSRIMERFFE